MTGVEELIVLALLAAGVVGTGAALSFDGRDLSGGLDEWNTFSANQLNNGWFTKSKNNDALYYFVSDSGDAFTDLGEAKVDGLVNAKDFVMSIVETESGVDEKGKDYVNFHPSVSVVSQKLEDAVAAAMPYFGVQAETAEAHNEVIKKTKEDLVKNYLGILEDAGHFFPALGRFMSYIDKNGVTYLDGDVLEAIGNSFKNIGLFEKAGYSNIEVPLNTIIRMEELSFSDSRAFFKEKYSEIAPEAKKEVVSKAIDVLFDYALNNSFVDNSSSWLLLLTCTSSFDSMHLYIHKNAYTFSFSKYEIDYINSGILPPTGNKVVGTIYDIVGTSPQSVPIYNIYTYGMSGGNPGATHNSITTSSFAYPGGLYLYDNAVSKSEGFKAIRRVGVVPSGDVKVGGKYGDLATNTYPGVAVKTINDITKSDEDRKVLYPVAVPTYEPSGKTKDKTQEEAQAGVIPFPTTDERIKDMIDSLQDIIADAIADAITITIPAVPEVKPGDSGDLPLPIVPSLGVPGIGMAAIYNPTQSQLSSFSRWLWSSNFIDNIPKLLNDPMESIVDLHIIYATPNTSGSSTIQCGYLDSGVSSKVVSNQYINIACGAIKIDRYFNNVLDYSPYTTIKCFLPFIGVVDLDTNEVMNSTLNITYRVDVLSGACLAQISVSRDDFGAVMYTFGGTCSVQLPISASNMSSMIKGMFGGIANGATVGGVPGAIAGALLGGFTGKMQVAHSGSIGSNAGAMGGKIPYLIITRPKSYEANNYSSYYGLPSNKTVKLSSCTGYTRVKDIHLENISSATDDELNEIESLLKEGVII